MVDLKCHVRKHDVGALPGLKGRFRYHENGLSWMGMCRVPYRTVKQAMRAQYEGTVSEREKNFVDAFFSCMRGRLLYSANANSLYRSDESEFP